MDSLNSEYPKQIRINSKAQIIEKLILKYSCPKSCFFIGYFSL